MSRLRKILSALVVPIVLLASLSKESDYHVDRFISDSLDIPISFLHSKRFRDFYKSYETKKHQSFLDVNSVQSYFIPELDRILRAEKVPEIFLFMAMAESNFATHARSSKSAVGIWQFIPQTAKKFGLRVDRYVDERKDPIKSTKAAVRYLKFLHKMFGKWYLAAIAYNAGEGTLLRAIKRAGTDDLFVLLDPEKKYLPKESRIYLYKIASLAKLSYDLDSKMSRELGYILARGDKNRIVAVDVEGIATLGHIASAIHLKESYLKELNPHLIRGFTPPGSERYSVYIPKFKEEEFRRNFRPAKLYNDFVVHKVRRGDTLIGIARRYGVAVADIRAFNRLRGSTIRIGQQLVIPVRKKRRTIYRVRPGDTIIKIAKRFGVDPKALKRWNNKQSNLIRVGEKLVVISE